MTLYVLIKIRLSSRDIVVTKILVCCVPKCFTDGGESKHFSGFFVFATKECPILHFVVIPSKLYIFILPFLPYSVKVNISR